MKKYILTLIVLIGLGNNLMSQNFKDVYQTLQTNDRFSNMMNLRHYLEINPELCVAYYLLGGIYSDYMTETNPIKHFSSLANDYSQLKTYYGLVQFKLDEKQARQDRDYYGDIEITTDKKKVTYPDILADIEIRLKKAEEYYSEAKILHDNYFRFVNAYNNCLNEFRDILGSYPKYKNLYLMATPDIIERIRNMSLNFDSSLVFFETYKKSCANFSHLLNVQSYKLVPIETYRLEGLVETDFTSDIVHLWDFGAWVKEFLENYKNEILVIRNGLIDNDEKLKTEIQKFLTATEYNDDFDHYMVDLRFQNLIGKYDYSSICNELINYQKAKLDFIINTKAEINDTSSLSPFYLINKMRFYSNLANKLNAINMQIEQVKNDMSMDEVSKYIDFFGQQYRGMDGFVRWCEIEKYRNMEVFNDNLKILNKFIYTDEHKYDYTDSAIISGNKKFAFGKQYQTADTVLVNTTWVNDVCDYKGRWFFQSMVDFDKDTVGHPFIVKLAKEGKTEWTYYPAGKNTDAEINAFQLLDDKSSFCVTSVKKAAGGSPFSEIHIDHLNWGGKKIHSFKYDSELTPVYFWFDEINNSYLVIEQGEGSIQTLGIKHPFQIKKYSANDSLQWQCILDIDGDLVDVIPTNSNFLVTFNFKDFSYEDVSLEANENALAIGSFYISENGKINVVNGYMGSNFVATNSSKISSNTFNILGTFQDENKEENQYFYLLTDEKGVPTFSNTDKMKFESFNIKL